MVEEQIVYERVSSGFAKWFEYFGESLEQG